MAILIPCDQLFPTLLDNYRDCLSVGYLCHFPLLSFVGSVSGCQSVTDDRWFSVDEIAVHLGVKRDTNIIESIARTCLPIRWVVSGNSEKKRWISG